MTGIIHEYQDARLVKMMEVVDGKPVAGTEQYFVEFTAKYLDGRWIHLIKHRKRCEADVNIEDYNRTCGPEDIPGL